MIYFDISLLAAAQQEPGIKTGPYRVVSELARTLFSLYPQDVFAACQQPHWLKDANAALCEMGVGSVVRGAWDLPPGSVYHQTFGAFPSCTNVPHLQRVMTLYDLFPASNPEWFPPKTVAWFNSVKASLRPEDKIVAISQATRHDALTHWSIPTFSSAVVHLASNLRPDEERSDKAISPGLARRQDEGAFFLSVCTLEPRKNLPRLIRAFFNFLTRTGSDAQLVIAGTAGWDLHAVLSAIGEDTILSERVILLGRVDDADLCLLYRHCVALIFVPLAEGFGLPALEAMQMGTAVITSDTTSLPEVVGDAALKVDPYCTSAISNAMESLWKEEDKRHRLARLGPARAKEFSWNKAAREYRAIYQQLTQ